ncbi:MAG TPA: 1,6-anhydro-N-acetylmuramyl-L-alanine amidase AmpD [Gammaproteobacteria bacterium]|nr:1,6-anhydro-N-acetylmuramyl-L-alanine amidase AmpD [Gammaproteobacteria bacterium]
MKIDLETGLLDIARQRPSPNCDDRPEGEVIELIVIHSISLPPNHFGGAEIEDFFCNQLDISAHPYFEEIKDMQVSAHLLVNRHGEIIQFVSFNQRAWHAGVSCYKDRQCCNDFSIGIELEGSDDTTFTDQQYRMLKQILSILSKSYTRLSGATIVGHNEISPGRKTDPGPFFDWRRIRNT